MRSMRWLALGTVPIQILLLVACVDSVDVLDVPCEADSDCEDGQFCNGQESCNKELGQCVRTAAPTCDDGIACTTDRCDPNRNVCISTADADGDGVDSIECGGADCDDTDARRFPNNPEVCDDENIDEDCDPTTFGGVDKDLDGLEDVGCCNVIDGQTTSCGNDCDDNDHLIVHGSQVCLKTKGLGDTLQICQRDGTWLEADCLPGMLCIPQPNGLGVCVP